MKDLGKPIHELNLKEHLKCIEFPRELPLKELCEKHRAFPLKLCNERGRKSLILAINDPCRFAAIQEIEFKAGMTVKCLKASEFDISRLIDVYYCGRDPRCLIESDADLELTYDHMSLLNFVA